MIMDVTNQMPCFPLCSWTAYSDISAQPPQIEAFLVFNHVQRLLAICSRHLRHPSEALVDPMWTLSLLGTPILLAQYHHSKERECAALTLTLQKKAALGGTLKQQSMPKRVFTSVF